MHPDDILTWEDVLKVHRVPRGVSANRGVLNSIIFSAGGSHGDAVEGNTIKYVVPNTSGYRGDISAMTRAHREQTAFAVFQKLGVNKYRNLGPHVISDCREQTDGTVFDIAPAS